VEEVVLASPPQRDGAQNQAVLAAAAIAGVDRVYRVGGAQAIAALAYGTETVEKVDKIVGPGNIFVVLAKQAVAGQVGIDGIPGPTETIVIADDAANPSWAAADMIAQAEHDPLAQSVLVCLSRKFADSVLAELDRLLGEAPRADVVRESFQRRGAIVIVEGITEAIAFANDHAPEHVCLAMANPWDYLASIRNAGGIFVGEGSVEALGDYTAGPSHIMPTGGTARFASALSLDDFIKVVPLFAYDAKQEEAAARAAIALAHAEGLSGHAAAIAARLEDTKDGTR
jgi:histidinol dehydrogenase